MHVAYDINLAIAKGIMEEEATHFQSSIVGYVPCGIVLPSLIRRHTHSHLPRSLKTRERLAIRSRGAYYLDPGGDTLKIEHAAWSVEEPACAADWYVAHLDMQIVRSGGEPAHARFLADSTGRVLLEIYNNPQVQIPDYRGVDPLIIHLAFSVEDVKAECERLVAAGATVHAPYENMGNGDEMAMLRDPWGFPIQILKRAEPM